MSASESVGWAWMVRPKSRTVPSHVLDYPGLSHELRNALADHVHTQDLSPWLRQLP